MCGAGLFCVLSPLKTPGEAVLAGCPEGSEMGAQCGYQLLLQTHRLTHGVFTHGSTHTGGEVHTQPAQTTCTHTHSSTFKCTDRGVHRDARSRARLM